ncbi:unnamed protein product [Zymoseptoria tritici ST99CH_3D1]|nr:unnamed protein product [Zymoseptoria tritici ST99CH_3D1]
MASSTAISILPQDMREKTQATHQPALYTMAQAQGQTGDEPLLPIELVLAVLYQTIPSSLDLTIARNTCGPHTCCCSISATDFSRWSTTRAFYAASPAIAHATGASSRARFPAHLTRLRVTLRRIHPLTAELEPVPDTILARFSTLEVAVPFSIHDHRGAITLALLSFTFARQSNDTWSTVTREWVFLTTHLPHASEMQHVQEVLMHLLRSGVDGLLHGDIAAWKLAKLRRDLAMLVKHARRDSMGFLPAGWGFDQLERAVGHVEEWEEDQRRAELAWRKMCKVLFGAVLLGLFVMVVSGISMAVAASEHAGIRGRR